MAKRGPRMSRSRLKAERAKPTAASLRDFDQAHVRIVSFTTDAAKPREHVCPLLSESRQTGRRLGTSALCQKPTYAVQQIWSLLNHLVGA